MPVFANDGRQKTPLDLALDASDKHFLFFYPADNNVSFGVKSKLRNLIKITANVCHT